MDISSILPLLMNKNGSVGAGNDKMNTLLKFAQGEKPDITTVMNMAMANRNNSQKPSGLKAVAAVCSFEILGKLSRYFL
ncbi:MAG: hypothetical protein HFE35_01830 [Clostridia bacterium]|jgi:hypothetical protein|uniref:hypothetical protein n=1 Tax=Pumilibacter muris TaxID=2941510 RepID=UPI00203CDB18|nr:hypothetical protein [Pumilibacter muris]MCI8595543.1 hypothetical protein [Clostridia bacterium]